MNEIPEGAGSGCPHSAELPPKLDSGGEWLGASLPAGPGEAPGSRHSLLLTVALVAQRGSLTLQIRLRDGFRTCQLDPRAKRSFTAPRGADTAELQ